MTGQLSFQDTQPLAPPSHFSKMLFVSKFHARILVQPIALQWYACHMRHHFRQVAQRAYPAPLWKGSFLLNAAHIWAELKEISPIHSLQEHLESTFAFPLGQTLLRKGSCKVIHPKV